MKKLRKIAVIIIIAVIAMIVFNNALIETTDTEPEVVKIDFSTATYEEKQAFIEAYLQNPNQAGIDIQTQMAFQIKKRFNYPESVSFGSNYPLLSNGHVIEADSGWVHINGKGTAENAFKQKTNFDYTAKLKITDKTISIESIDISQ